ncbi:MAG: murein L,D-transpeptidase [Actinobacteria bacterium]|nr:murein L,D-transpeptidase [Actinomycetota bacterium]
MFRRLVTDRHVLAAGAALVLVACSAAEAETSSSLPASIAAIAPSSSEAATTTSTSTTSTSTTTVPPATTTTTTLAVPLLDRAIAAVGSRDGEETVRVQQRLLEAGFWLVAVDGDYGHTTKQAVMAFQKYYGLKATGKVDENTALALTQVSTWPQARSTDQGTVVEVDKDRQVLMIVVNGRVLWVLNTSTGSGQWFLEQNQKDLTKWELGRSITDSGRFKINRERSNGWWAGDLGEIYRPKYFNGGIAIHGSRSIPNYPASHGCVRVSTAAMDMIWETGILPKGTPVWVYGNDIEAENEKPEMPTTTTSTSVPALESTTSVVAP